MTAAQVSRDMKKIPSFVSAALILLSGPAPYAFPASAQEAAKEPRALQYEVAVTLKLIQAYVTDRKGHPVRDLTVGDFAVTDEGRPVTLTEFERHVLDEPGRRMLRPRPAGGAVEGHEDMINAVHSILVKVVVPSRETFSSRPAEGAGEGHDGLRT